MLVYCFSVFWVVGWGSGLLFVLYGVFDIGFWLIGEGVFFFLVKLNGSDSFKSFFFSFSSF